jgi:hypothetical protein
LLKDQDKPAGCSLIEEGQGDYIVLTLHEIKLDKNFSTGNPTSAKILTIIVFEK